jgi:hypothetical protein
MVLSYTEKMDEEAQFFRERFGDHDPEEFDLEETHEMLKEFDFEYKRGWDSQTRTNLLLSVQICSGLLFIFEI